MVLAADAVAYLPYFIANELKPWIDVPGGRRLTWDEAFAPHIAAPQAIVRGQLDEAQTRGDLGCLNAVEQAWDVNGEAWIGICDPCEIPLMTKSSDLVVVGGLIRKACFWCIVDGGLAGARSLDKLAAEHLAIHEPGFATGNRIGMFAAQAIHDRQGAWPAIYDGDIGLVVDGAVYLREEKKVSKIAAITASVLSAAIGKHTGLFELAFPLHELPTFSDFLTTGFVVHRKALEDDEFRSHLLLFLFGLIYATRFLKDSPEASKKMLFDVCQQPNRFLAERRLHSARIQGKKIVEKKNAPTTPAQVTDAAVRTVHNLLVNDDIYAPDCEITPEQWQAAYFGSRREQRLAESWPPLTSLYRPEILQQAQRLFRERMGSTELQYQMRRLDAQNRRVLEGLRESKYRWRFVYVFASVLFFAYIILGPPGRTLKVILTHIPAGGLMGLYFISWLVLFAGVILVGHDALGIPHCIRRPARFKRLADALFGPWRGGREAKWAFIGLLCVPLFATIIAITHPYVVDLVKEIWHGFSKS